MGTFCLKLYTVSVESVGWGSLPNLSAPIKATNSRGTVTYMYTQGGYHRGRNVGLGTGGTYPYYALPSVLVDFNYTSLLF